MVSTKSDNIDFSKFEKELDAAVEYDSRYWRENDAKFRAVNQKVATYEEFRDIVAAAHLKPLEKTDRIGNSFKQTWNSTADHNCTTHVIAQSSQVDGLCSSVRLPRNGHEFNRQWKNLSSRPEMQYDFLLRIGCDHIRRIFHSEIGFGLLGQIIQVLDNHYQDAHSSHIITILQGLAEANRFQLSMDFLDSDEKAACQQLFNKLYHTSFKLNSPIDSQIKQTYRVQ